MQEQLEKLKQDFQKLLKDVNDTIGLEALDQKFFSRKSGELSLVMRQLGTLSDDMRREFGRVANEIRQEMEKAFAEKKSELGQKAMGDIADKERIDVTQPKLLQTERGHLHPVTQVTEQINRVAESMGFLIEDGPELESDYYNFTAVNIPPDHPARDMQDTFYVKNHPNWVMRTHVSNMQVRLMQKYGVPIRTAYPGRCFRNEATDPRHEHTMYQWEALIVGEDINFSHMIGIIESLLNGLFGEKVQIRLRPKFYPFVEPGANVEMTCFLCRGKGCRVCKGSGWLEIAGAGVVHPAVFREAGVDSKKWSGVAFGMGLSRLVMLKYGIEDVRHLQSGDMRFLEQF